MAVTRSRAADGTVSGRPRVTLFAMEGVGNFVLVFAFGSGIAMHDWFAPLVIGAALVAMVYFRNRVPGGHYNPALTLAMLIRRRIEARGALAYWLIQLGAGMLAAATVRAIVDPTQLAITAAMTVQGSNLLAALAVELVFTCALCYVALDVSPGVGNRVVSYHGWPTTVGVVAGAVAIGVITTGAFDPTADVHDIVLGIFSWPTLWVYLVSQLLSGIAATITFISVADHQ